MRVLAGRDRVESDRFSALRSHFGFDAFFCEPGAGGAHEKGGVGGEVGRFRRRHLVPVPRVESLAELNALLAASAACGILYRGRRWVRRVVDRREWSSATLSPDPPNPRPDSAAGTRKQVPL